MLKHCRCSPFCARFIPAFFHINIVSDEMAAVADTAAVAAVTTVNMSVATFTVVVAQYAVNAE